MTATMNQFGNRQHRDKDLAPLVFGLWFPAKQIGAGKGPKRRQWGIRPDADHNKMSGGEFLWGAYGIGVDFQRASGLVDIFWRGQLDYHGTIDGTEPDGFTRFGTSVQITASGVRAMQKLWNVEELTACGHNVKLLDTGKKVTTIQDRANAAASRAPGIRAGRWSQKISSSHVACRDSGGSDPGGGHKFGSLEMRRDPGGGWEMKTGRRAQGAYVIESSTLRFRDTWVWVQCTLYAGRDMGG
ncbi:hypothetical protein C8J57DRAFT_1598766 [Mycena rebaudengoi]|nr:hypothetical protein C8J57DRAFT_1598766 [Mycena rebaudengoi]